MIITIVWQEKNSKGSDPENISITAKEFAYM